MKCFVARVVNIKLFITNVIEVVPGKIGLLGFNWRGQYKVFTRSLSKSQVYVIMQWGCFLCKPQHGQFHEAILRDLSSANF